MTTNSYFVIIGTNDSPLYEAEFGPIARGEVAKVILKLYKQLGIILC